MAVVLINGKTRKRTGKPKHAKTNKIKDKKGNAIRHYKEGVITTKRKNKSQSQTKGKQWKTGGVRPTIMKGKKSKYFGKDEALNGLAQ